MARQRRKRPSSLSADMSRWLAYSVIFSLFPLFLHFLYLRTQVPLTVTLWSTLRATLARGDLFLMTYCLGGAAQGEHIARGPARPKVEIFLTLACQLSVVASVFFYTLASNNRLNTGVVATLSCSLFILTVLTSAGLTFIQLQERRQR
jgi:hypothetical protein